MRWESEMRWARLKVPSAGGTALVLAAVLVAQPIAGAQGLPSGAGQAPETVVGVLSSPCTTPVPPGAASACPQQAPVIAQVESAGAAARAVNLSHP
jgi:hypothetical protein